jgi:hypothetical protein
MSLWVIWEEEGIVGMWIRRKGIEHPDHSRWNHDITPPLPWYFPVSIRDVSLIQVPIAFWNSIQEVIQKMTTQISRAVFAKISVIWGDNAWEMVRA